MIRTLARQPFTKWSTVLGDKRAPVFVGRRANPMEEDIASDDTISAWNSLDKRSPLYVGRRSSQSVDISDDGEDIEIDTMMNARIKRAVSDETSSVNITSTQEENYQSDTDGKKLKTETDREIKEHIGDDEEQRESPDDEDKVQQKEQNNFYSKIPKNNDETEGFARYLNDNQAEQITQNNVLKRNDAANPWLRLYTIYHSKISKNHELSDKRTPKFVGKREGNGVAFQTIPRRWFMDPNAWHATDSLEYVNHDDEDNNYLGKIGSTEIPPVHDLKQVDPDEIQMHENQIDIENDLEKYTGQFSRESDDDVAESDDQKSEDSKRAPMYVGKRAQLDHIYMKKSHDDDDLEQLSSDMPQDENIFQSMNEKRRGPSFVGKRRAPDFVGKRAAPDFVRKRLSSTWLDGKKSAPGFVGKRKSPNFVGKRPVPGFVGKRIAPNFEGKQQALSFVHEKMNSDIASDELAQHISSKRPVPGFVGKKDAPGFIGKRPSPNFVGKRPSPNFVGKRPSPNFVGKRPSPNFVGKRPSPNFVGKRPSPNFVDKRPSPSFVGK
jgi:hypothetical protein